jgi:kynureninase
VTGPALDQLAERAAALDRADPLAHARERFLLPDGVVYLDGNSLGPLSRTVPAKVADAVSRQWGSVLIDSWTGGWWDKPEAVGDRIARLIGAAPGQVAVTDSTSVNVFKVLVAAMRAASPRTELIVDASTFPTDGYLAASVARLTGSTLVPVHPDDLAATVSERTGAVLLNHVDFRTGRLHDMAGLTRACHAVGALAVWDVSHSVGVLPLELDAHGVDLVVGCTYKFLNGGPGAPAFVYVPTDRQDAFDQPLTGWSGHADPFGMTVEYAPAPGIRRARTGTPDMLSLLALDAALDAWDGIEMSDVRAKGLALTGFFIECVDRLLDPAAVTVLTPRDTGRGHQVSLQVDGAEQLLAAMKANGVVGDYRPPSVLRYGFAPLYIGYADALRAADTLRRLLAEGS